jgi:hypothetical protein
MNKKNRKRKRLISAFFLFSLLHGNGTLGPKIYRWRGYVAVFRDHAPGWGIRSSYLR